MISERSVIFMRKKLIQITISNLTGNIQLGEQLNAFFGVATWLYDVLLVVSWLNIVSFFFSDGIKQTFFDDFGRISTKLRNCSLPRVSIKFTVFTTFLFTIVRVFNTRKSSDLPKNGFPILKTFVENLCSWLLVCSWCLHSNPFPCWWYGRLASNSLTQWAISGPEIIHLKSCPESSKSPTAPNNT